MKKIIILASSAFFTLSFASCKKCTHCIVTHKATGYVAQDYGEYCASSSEIKDYQSALPEIYPTTKYSISCTDK